MTQTDALLAGTALLPEESTLNWYQTMRGLGYLQFDQTSSSYSLNKLTKEQRDDFVMRSFFYMYDLRRNHYIREDLYLRRIPDRYFTRLSHDHRELVDIVTSLYQTFFQLTPATSIQSTIQNIYNHVTQDADLDNGIWYLCHNLFFDAQLLTFTDNPRDYAYRILAATHHFTTEDRDALVRSFNRHKALLADKQFDKAYKDLPMEYEFIKLWADPSSDGYQDKYWDIMIAYSTLFMWKKPPIAYFLIGNARGGKSSMVNTIHHILGDNNTARVTLKGMSDWSLNNTLLSCMANAPDEDPAEPLSAESRAYFKSIAAHEPVVCRVKNSALPLTIKPDFCMFFPKNSLPEFGGDAEACMKRTRPIMFTNDLSQYDNLPKDFIRDTFTPTFLADFLGSVFALTHYFDPNHHAMWYSPEMQGASTYVAESTNSTSLYYRDWKKYFYGYESFQLLWTDYVLYCKHLGYDIEKKEVLRQRFFIEGQHRAQYMINKERVNIYITNTSKTYREGKEALSSKSNVPRYGPIDESHEKGMSYVAYKIYEDDVKDIEAKKKKKEFERGWRKESE